MTSKTITKERKFVLFTSELCPENLSNLTSVSHTACASNAMDILLYISWHVKVDHMAHIWNIQATSSNLKNTK